MINDKKTKIGMTFGDLCVVARLDDVIPGYPRWLCKCVCGNICVKRSSELLRKNYPAKSCGCKAKCVHEDLVGRKFHYLTVIKRVKNNKHRNACWLCKCVCGKEVVLTTGALKHKKHPVKSCGCMTLELIRKAVTVHGMKSSPLYNVWKDMRRRCNNPKDKSYMNYGCRGISVCKSWSESFMSFWQDMHGTYQEGMQLDRIDNDGNYEPENCRWATIKENQRNKRTNRVLHTLIGAMTVAEFCECTGVRHGNVYARLKRGFPEELLFVKPNDQRRYRFLGALLHGDATWLEGKAGEDALDVLSEADLFVGEYRQKYVPSHRWKEINASDNRY